MTGMTDTDTDTSTGPGVSGGSGADEWVAVGVRPAHVVAAVTDTLSQLDDTWWALRPAGELLATMRGLERLRSVLDWVQLQVAAEIDHAGAARTEGWASTKDYLTAVGGGRKGAGRRTLALAEALTGDREQTGLALGRGDLSRAQAEVITTTVDRLPVNPALRQAAEQLLVEQARDHDATDLTALARTVLTRLDPDGDEAREERLLEREERAAHHSRFLSLTDDGLGGVRLAGRGTVEDAAWIRNALYPLAAPTPTSRPGTCGGDPHQPARSCGVTDCAHDGRDPREHGTRLWDALVQATRTLADTDQLPESHGARPRISLTLDYDTLLTGLGQATLDTGSTLSAATARRLACDADLIPVVLGTGSQPLDVGRTHRLVTPAQWTALVTRDRHCAFPGCTRLPHACDAHHLQHWADGGPTALHNLVLLCRGHHTTLHTTPWQVEISPHDHHPQFHPPPRHPAITPTQTPTPPLRRMPLRT